ncbi:hypothetical protein AMTRI_Chr13g86310 [Amborella trichopoda]
MGNHITSCTPIICTTSSGKVKVMRVDGRVEEYTRPIRVAELMLENPQNFVCFSGDLQSGRRIPAIPADEQLEGCKLYFLFPMEKLYSVLCEEEMEELAGMALEVTKPSGGKNFGRIFPIFGEFCLFSPQVKGVEMREGDHNKPELLTRQRSMQWRPALETISEFPWKQSHSSLSLPLV